jgi:hypothetical protein
MIQRIKLFERDEALEIGRLLKEGMEQHLKMNYGRTDKEAWNHVYPDSRDLFWFNAEVYFNPKYRLQDAVANTKIAGSLDHVSRFFTRFAFPGQTCDGACPLETTILSPGHYDNYGHKKGSFSIWTPFTDTNVESGSFWWSDHPSVIRWYNDKYGLHDPQEYYRVSRAWGKEAMAEVIDHINMEYCNAGEALIFPPTLLHGSTTAKSQMRISYDFRIVL